MAAWLATAPVGSTQDTADFGEVQAHGITFEEWVRETFFHGYQPGGHTQKWDIPAEANLRHGGIPVNPKATRYGSPIGLGDALRQFDVDEPFLLIAGFWIQDGDRKRYVKAVAVAVAPGQWRKLWGPVTRDDIERLDALIKDRSIDYREARRLAQEKKSRPPFSETVITLNPKIDSRGQRRLQCSLSFRRFFAHLAPDVVPVQEETPLLFGVPLPEPFYSPPRAFGP